VEQLQANASEIALHRKRNPSTVTAAFVLHTNRLSIHTREAQKQKIDAAWPSS
jgi:hypothetical protein